MAGITLFEYRKILELDKCEPCKSGGDCGCRDRESGVAWIEDSKTGKRRYFCNTACMILALPEETWKGVAESRFNVEGHYEQMARG